MVCRRPIRGQRSRADADGDGKVDRYPLVSDALSSYFWSYDNQGLRLAQLRFYEVSTTVQ